MSNRNAAIDGIRGIAVAAVILFHLDLADSGFLGVDVFFVLSGFLITSIVLAEHRRTGTIRLRRFYARRALRLYPALALVVAAVVFIAAAADEALITNLRDAAFSLLYVSNISGLAGGLLDHTWTLSIEEQFYLLWPAILLLCLGPRRKIGLALAAVLLLGLLAADLTTNQRGVLHTYVRAMGLPLGCALALGRDTRAWWVLAKLGPLALALLIVCFLLPLPPELSSGWPLTCGALLATPIVAMAAESRPGWLQGSLIVWLGLRSYSLYLWHFPLLSLAGHHAPARIPHWAALSMGMLATLVASEVSYRLVEQTILHWRDREFAPVTATTLP